MFNEIRDKFLVFFRAFRSNLIPYSITNASRCNNGLIAAHMIDELDLALIKNPHSDPPDYYNILLRPISTFLTL
jgi:hypothetical protein